MKKYTVDINQPILVTVTRHDGEDLMEEEAKKQAEKMLRASSINPDKCYYAGAHRKNYDTLVLEWER